MPILPAEADRYPDNLWSDDVALNGDGRWWCLHAKPRQEKSVARELYHHAIVHYLPQTYKDGRTPGGRKTRSLVPLFPGYLFLYGGDHARVEALKGNRLVKILAVPDQERLTLDLKQLFQVLSSGLAVLHEPTYPVGSVVRVKDGPLTGVIGRIVRRGKRDQFSAIVHFLGQGATVDLEDWQVEPVHDDRDDF
jgi:transcription antitermination factor NusG